jgi:hypothetical protein
MLQSMNACWARRRRLTTTSVRRRWILAISLSIVLNEITVGVLHIPGPSTEVQRVVLFDRIAIVHRPTPRPSVTPTLAPSPTPVPVVRVSPTPTPVPTLVPIVALHPRATIAPVSRVAAVKAAGRRAPTHGGARAKHLAQHFHHFTIVEQIAKSKLGKAVGINGVGAGSGAGSADGGGAEGQTAGVGQGGAGTADADANTPCGEVEFNVHAPPQYRNGVASERVTATVRFPDGHVESTVFPYLWIYENGEHDDPWSATNLAKKDLQIPLVFPPSGTDTATLPPLIVYILDHTKPDGTTILQTCPHYQS